MVRELFVFSHFMHLVHPWSLWAAGMKGQVTVNCEKVCFRNDSS